jgi:TPP-dependent pyruvate/acetoin dehydrogenase alpha subunit
MPLTILLIPHSALGDPLIKGLTEVANLRPSDPVQFLANYLHNFSVDSKPKTSTVRQKRETTATIREEEEKPKIQPKPVQNHFVSTNHVTSAKKKVMAKEKSVENFIDDHDDFDSTPGMDERGESCVKYKF